MIVECGSCGTRFQLDDARVPDAGIRVRCSKCKQSFFLPHPSETSEGATSDAPLPGEARDLSVDGPSRADSRSTASRNVGEDPVDPLGDAVAAINPAGGRAGALAEDDEADWEFNEDPNAAARRDVDSDSDPGLDGLVSSSGLDLATPDDDPVSAASDFEPFGAGVGLDDDDASSAPPEPTPPVARPEAALAREVGEDLGSPEDWDFLSDGPLAAGAPVAGARPAVGRSMGVAIGALGSAKGQRAKPPLGEGESSSAPMRREIQNVVSAIGWVVCLSLFAVGAARGLLPADLVHGVPDAVHSVVPVGSLQAEASRGSWLDTAGHGRLFLVTGELRNPGRSAATAGASLRIAVFGADGELVPIEPSFAGVGLSEQMIRESSSSELTASQSEAAQRLAQVPVMPGAAVPFYAVLRELPLAAARFELEVVDAVALAPQSIVLEEAALRIDSDEFAVSQSASLEAAEEVPTAGTGTGSAQVVPLEAEPRIESAGEADLPAAIAP